MHLGVAAMGSGLVGSFVVTPVERIKVVMQAAIASAPSPSRLPNAAAAAAAATTAVAGGVTGGVWTRVEHGLNNPPTPRE